MAHQNPPSLGKNQPPGDRWFESLVPCTRGSILGSHLTHGHLNMLRITREPMGRPFDPWRTVFGDVSGGADGGAAKEPQPVHPEGAPDPY